MKAAANSTTIFNYLAATSIRTGFGIANMRLISDSRTGCIGISIDGNTTGIRCSLIRIRDLNIEDTFSFGINLKYCANTFINNVFTSSVANGFYIDNCADTDIVSCKAQNGSSYGFYINGGGGAFDEGCRLVACSTNGQVYGLGVNGQDWGDASGCSFTTASGGALIAATATNWKFSACECAVAGGTPGAAGALIGSACSGFSFSTCQFSNNTYGANVDGTNHNFTGCYFLGNSNVDLYFNNAVRCAASGNGLHSSTVAWSVLEAGTANYNNIVGNVGNGTFTTTGAQSAAASNVTY
jgi:hypothetical protein